MRASIITWRGGTSRLRSSASARSSTSGRSCDDERAPRPDSSSPSRSGRGSARSRQHVLGRWRSRAGRCGCRAARRPRGRRRRAGARSRCCPRRVASSPAIATTARSASGKGTARSSIESGPLDVGAADDVQVARARQHRQHFLDVEVLHRERDRLADQGRRLGGGGGRGRHVLGGERAARAERQQHHEPDDPPHPGGAFSWLLPPPAGERSSSPSARARRRARSRSRDSRRPYPPHGPGARSRSPRACCRR